MFHAPSWELEPFLYSVPAFLERVTHNDVQTKAGVYFTRDGAMQQK